MYILNQPAKMPHSCSFCNLPGHNITSCNDILIDIHYDRIKTIYLNIIRQIYPYNIEIYTELGKSILNARFNLKELRAVGVKYLNINAQNNKANLIFNIWRYLKNRIFYIRQEELELENINPPPLELIDTTHPSLIQLRLINEYRIINYYRDDSELVNYMIPMINVLASETEEEEEGTSPNPEPVINVNKKYNIIPILSLDENEEKEEINCAICYENIKCDNLVKLNCSHQFCSCCIISILKTNNQSTSTCALCRAVICEFKVKNLEIYNLVAEYCNL